LFELTIDYLEKGEGRMDENITEDDIYKLSKKHTQFFTHRISELSKKIEGGKEELRQIQKEMDKLELAMENHKKIVETISSQKSSNSSYQTLLDEVRAMLKREDARRDEIKEYENRHQISLRKLEKDKAFLEELKKLSREIVDKYEEDKSLKLKNDDFKPDPMSYGQHD
jgi:flagellar biosynthesis component FlhA